MGKNQGYKAMQRARVGSSSGSAAPDEIEDGMVDGSYHTPEWHAARLAGLQTTHTITWEEYKKKQKDEELKKGELEADTDKLMREYRAQLDAERAMKLSKGRNYISSDKSRKDKKERDVTDRKDRDSRRKKSKKRKRSRRHSSDSSSSSSSSSESSSSDEEESRRSRSSSKRSKREKKHKSKSRHSSKSSKDEDDGPVPLSKFFGNLKKS
ncbi:protein FAM133 [Brassica rapa]|uniref:Uncharacterized protein n=1 Tax=Brassica campestris TaxID=3711 RepID=A0A3P5Z1A8_BRACM|nr:protein FAM133 [Brassica rapa]CAG7873887.1 unnamed protein product [Brassica rapa]VDC69674.1 unnamed protein product [Brassica rapa]